MFGSVKLRLKIDDEKVIEAPMLQFHHDTSILSELVS